MGTVKKVKRKLNVKALILILLIIYVIGVLFYTIFTMPIKNIIIKNTSLLTDYEIIEVAGIKNYPSFFRTSKKSLETKIKTLELVNDVNVTKKLNGTIIIEIDEARPLFYNRNSDMVVLSNGNNVANNSKYTGIPTLINYVTSDLLSDFVDAFKNIDTDIIAMINEIEYDPDVSGDVVIDDERFLLRMNDTNEVYINIINMEKLNDYKEIYASLTTSGTILLDSYSDGDVIGIFTPFAEESDSEENGEN